MRSDVPEWAAALRQLRQERGFSRRALAEAAKVSFRAIECWETGSNSARPDARRRVLGVLGVPMARHREFFGVEAFPAHREQLATEVPAQ